MVKEGFIVKTCTKIENILTLTIYINEGNITSLYDWVLVLNPLPLDTPDTQILSDSTEKYILGISGDIFSDMQTDKLEKGVYYAILSVKYMEDYDEIITSGKLLSIIKLPIEKEKEFLENIVPMI